MPIPRLELSETALLVVDVQEKLIPAVIDRERLVQNCGIMLLFAAKVGMPYLVTEHYPKGLGRTVETITAAMADPSARIEKTSFSALVDLVDETLRQWRRTSILVCGLEAHICVLQTVLDLHASGRQCYLVSDAISAAPAEQGKHAFRRMEAAGAITTGVVSAMYELAGDARHPSFPTCRDLAKRVAR